MTEKYNYDAIIIGSGIGGLVCGCYLAKSGLNVLLIEKNTNVGGYCTSFTRGQFKFDACVHCLCSCRESGRMFLLLQELGLLEGLNLTKYDPGDTIVTPDYKINIFHDARHTAEEFTKAFPDEKTNIDNFFQYISANPILSFMKIKGISFEEMLDNYFSNKKLKSILSILMFQLMGLHPSKLSATAACLLWKEFLLDGGYYPNGGMQAFPDALAGKFKEFGGNLTLRKEVKKIIIDANKAKGVILNDDTHIYGKYIISACDIRKTLFELVGSQEISREVKSIISKAQISSSGFLVYLGVDESAEELSILKSNIYLISDIRIDSVYKDYLKGKNSHFVINSPTLKSNNSVGTREVSICLGTNGIYRSEKYWSDKNRNIFADRLIKLSEIAVPGLSKKIALKLTATPHTLYKWTYNYKGTAYGWASTPKQYCNMSFESIGGLFNVGHWSNQGSGITSVVNSGHKTAGRILAREKI